MAIVTHADGARSENALPETSHHYAPSIPLDYADLRSEILSVIVHTAEDVRV